MFTSGYTARDQAENSLGATKRMLFFAITHLQSQQEPPKKPPSWHWFQGFLKKSTILHTVKTKPISKQQVEIHSEEAIEHWFEQELRPKIKEQEIRHGSQIYIMDESGSRIGCPKGEKVVVPVDYKRTLYIKP